MFKFTGRRPSNLGVNNGKLAPVPGKPNCVSSQADANDRVHHIAPLAVSGDAKAALKKLKAAISALPRTNIVEARPDYLYVEFSTPLMGYVDDVELYAESGAIQVRSASRLGYSDLGVNRKRVEMLRAAL